MLARLLCGFMALRLLSGIAILPPAEAKSPRSLSRLLRDFHENPSAELNRPLLKRNHLGQPVSTTLSDTALPRLLALQLKDRIRSEVCLSSDRECDPPSATQLYSAIEDDDKPEDLIESDDLIRDLKAMESFRKGRAGSMPWSGSFWPFTNGMIATRYADPHYPRSGKWYENYQYVLNAPPQLIASSQNAQAINQLSPAEKYDLLVGDDNFTLTQKMWDIGLKEYKESCESSKGEDCTVLNWEGL